MFFGREKKAIMASMQECLLGVQENNKNLATVISQILPASNPEKEESIDPWRAVYALNLCTVSVSQIIETNDLRFMEQEYDNILNNLNLEMMPKDEALLDILKQILDVINYFKIQSKEKELLEKEYQQKLKDAVWSAVPNPSVILAGGKSGWVGLAVSAAVAVGTSYMNYRKEKARINNEQERKNWELERSAMEQLHGLQRQLFETAWRLADKYKFDDKYRLTERQINQFLNILDDTDDLRRFNRLEYIQDKFNAYPPFWYHMGSAALYFAYKESDESIRCEYLRKAQHCFDEFFEHSKREDRLLREDPVVAQCTFEYLAVINQLEAGNHLTEGEIDRNNLIQRIDATVESSGNAPDVLQQCALNYIALGQRHKAIRIMKALVNEQYNTYSNVQLLSVLYVEEHLNGSQTAKVEYELIKRDYEEGMYPFIENISQKENADIVFLYNQKIFLAKRLTVTLENYFDRRRFEFSELLSQNYNITEDVINFLYETANDLCVLVSDAHIEMSNSIERFINNKCDGTSLRKLLEYKESRRGLTLDSMLKNFIKSTVKYVISCVNNANNMQTLSELESQYHSFCEKQNLIFRYQKERTQTAIKRNSIESVLLGSDFETYKEGKVLFDKYLKIASEQQYKDGIIIESKRAEFLVGPNAKIDRYKVENSDKLYGVSGEIFAIVKDLRGIIRDLVFTTSGLYVLSKKKVKHTSSFSSVSAGNNNKSLVVSHYSSKGVTFYDQQGINYALLNDMISRLKRIEQSESKPAESDHSTHAININLLVENEIKKWPAP